MARFGNRTSAPILVRRPLAPCPIGSGPACHVEQLRSEQASGQQARLNSEGSQTNRYMRWETAIGRLQGALACSPDCPLADVLLKTVCELSRRQNPLAEVCPELDPAPNGGPWRPCTSTTTEPANFD